MQNAIPTDMKTLSRFFANRSIPTNSIGFYNHPKFLECEQDHPELLEFYAAWVRSRARDKAYDRRVRAVVPKLASILANEILDDGQLGVCIDASMMLTKMLEEQEIWCYAAKGALSIEAKELRRPTHFWLYDTEPCAGHVWVVAPPFEIIDVALKSQPYEQNEADLVPATIVLEGAKNITPDADDFLSSDIQAREYARRRHLPKDVHFQLAPELARVGASFPSWEVRHGDTTLRYATGGVTMSEGASLYDITSRQWNGRQAGALYDEVIVPGLHD